MIKKFHLVFVVKNILTAVIFITGIVIFFSSCKIYKPAYYFKDIKRDTIITGFVHNDVELKIQKNDQLTISISSLNPAEDLIFNKTVSVGADAKTSGYQVSQDGNINLHKLGKIKVEGLSRKELKAKLENDLLPYLKDPIININFANHRVTVFGETGSVIVEMPEEKIALVEVMAKGGGITVNSQLSKIMVIREAGNAREIKHLNLEDPSIFSSPWYYLQPNDIVVVKPNEEKIETEQKRTRDMLLYTTIVSGITFIFLILDRVLQ